MYHSLLNSWKVGSVALPTNCLWFAVTKGLFVRDDGMGRHCSLFLVFEDLVRGEKMSNAIKRCH